MSPSIGTAVSRVMGGDPREVPRWTQPIVLEKSQLKRLEPPIAGRHWYDWPEMRLEVEEAGKPIDPSSPAIAWAPYYKVWQDDGSYLLQLLTAALRGTHAARIAVRERAAKQPKPLRPVDMLDVVSLLTGHTQHGKFAIRGAPSILARYKSKGIEFAPVGDGSDVVVTAAGGQLLNDHRDGVRLLSPLLAPFLLTGRVDCELTHHREPVNAITLAFGIPDPIPWCMECSPK